MLFLLLIPSLASASAAPFSLDDYARILSEKAPTTLEAALPLLPREFRRNPVLMRQSRSLQFSDAREPRAILSNEDGTFILAFNGSGVGRGQGAFEMIQFHRDTRRFEFAEIEFFGNRAPEIRRNVNRCSGCHGGSEDLHPVWESFAKWPGAYGEDGDRLESFTEAPAFRDFLKASAKSPRYGALVDLRSTHAKSDGEGRLAGRPNATLLRKLMRLNFERIADRVVRGAAYAANRYAMLASIYCVKESGFARDFLAGLGNPPDELLGLEENASPYSPSAIAFFWQIYKRGYSPFGWSMAFGDSLNQVGAKMPEPNAEYGTGSQELARAFAERDPKIAALVGRDGRKTPSCADLRARVNRRE